MKRIFLKDTGFAGALALIAAWLAAHPDVAGRLLRPDWPPIPPQMGGHCDMAGRSFCPGWVVIAMWLAAHLIVIPCWIAMKN